MSEEISILLSADENYARSCATTILSALENTDKPDQFHFYILSPDLSQESLRKIETICQNFQARVTLFFIDTDTFKSYKFAQELFNPNKYSRLFGPNLCTQSKKILYLDCDLIILGDLAELFQYDLQEKIIGAVPQVQFSYQNTFIENFGITSQGIYFNSGILLIDAVRWREAEITKTALNFIAKNATKFHYNDQDALNGIFWGDYYCLPGKWNVEARLYGEKLLGLPQTPEITERMKNPKVIHYTGSDKPWSSNNYVAARSRYTYYSDELTKLVGWKPVNFEPKRAKISSFLKFTFSCLYFRASQVKQRIFSNWLDK